MSISSGDNPTMHALEQFYARDEQRKITAEPRLLLHLVGSGHDRHVAVLDEGVLSFGSFLLHRFKLLFHPKAYDIKEIRSFLDSQRIAVPTHIYRKIEEKVAHSEESIVTKTFHLIFGRKDQTVARSAPKPPDPAVKVAPEQHVSYATQLNNFLDKLLKAETGAMMELVSFRQTLDEFRPLVKQHPELAPFEQMGQTLLERKTAERTPPLPPPANVLLIQIEKQLGDGNCLLRSFAVACGQKTDDHPRFRAEAAKWLETHWKKDAHLRAVILHAISDNNESEQRLYNENKPFLELVSQGCVEGIDDEQKNGALLRLKEVEARYLERFIPESLSAEEKIERYILLSKKETFFCDNPHIIALSHLYNVSIEVYNSKPSDGGELVLIKNTLCGCILPEAKNVISLHYDSEGVHYNAIVSRPATPPSPSTPLMDSLSEIETLTSMLSDLSIEDEPDLRPYQQTLERVKKSADREAVDIAQIILKSKQEGIIGLQRQRQIEALANIGKGIVNPGNTCYINAPLQGLRAMHDSFKIWLERAQRDLTQDRYPLLTLTHLPATSRYELYSVLLASLDVSSLEAKRAILQPKCSDEKMLSLLLEVSSMPREVREKVFKELLLVELQAIFTELNRETVTADTIKTFRQLVRLSGLVVPEETEQQDAHDFVMHLLDAIESPSITYQTVSEVEGTDGITRILPRVEKSNHINLSLGLGFTDSIQSLIGRGPQRIAFLSEDLVPQMLPIRLTRFAYERSASKLQDSVTPSSTIDIAIETNPAVKVRYRLKAITVHEGLSLTHGHYVSYVPNRLDRDGAIDQWVRFDDSVMALVSNDDIYHRGWDDERLVLTELRQNGYIYFYEQEGFVETERVTS